MVRIRLSRVGTKNQPKYRIIVADEQVARNGKFIEILGEYDPTLKPAKINFKKDRWDYWLKQGAQPSEAIEKLLTQVA